MRAGSRFTDVHRKGDPQWRHGWQTLRSLAPLCHDAQASTCGVVLGMRTPSPNETDSLLHHKSGHHADHALIGFRVTEDVAVPGPRPGVVGVDEHREALTGGDR